MGFENMKIDLIYNKLICGNTVSAVVRIHCKCSNRGKLQLLTNDGILGTGNLTVLNSFGIICTVVSFKDSRLHKYIGQMQFEVSEKLQDCAN